MIERRYKLAARLGISVTTLDRYADDPEMGLKKIKKGRTVFFDTTNFALTKQGQPEQPETCTGSCCVQNVNGGASNE